MKANELANALTFLIKALKENPDADIKNLNFRPRAEISRSPSLGAGNTAGALALLVQLAEFKKPQLVELINQFELDVVVKQADSRRDLLDRILRHLVENKQAHKTIVEKAKKPQSGASSELMQALAILMKS